MTPNDFVPHLLTALADLTGHEAGAPVPVHETMDLVCDRMGISMPDHDTKRGKTSWVHQQIRLAFRHLLDNGLGEHPKHGHWALTQAGIDQLDDEGNEEDLVVRHPYSDDPYIRGLAVNRTSCFGAHSASSEVCKECPFRVDCETAVSIRKARIAAELEHKEFLAKKAVEDKKKKKARQNASINELMAKMDGVAASKKGVFKPRKDQDVSTATPQHESICTQCGEKIPENSHSYWVRGEGMFHPECIDVPVT